MVLYCDSLTVCSYCSVEGPSIVLSFLVAAVIAVLGVLCFTEFAARVPRAGGSYIYMYASLGELAAFIMGWCLLVGKTHFIYLM